MNGLRVALFVTALLASPPAPAKDSHVRLNTVGFQPDAPKRASVAAPCDRFSVVRASHGAEVLIRKPGAPAANADTGESIQTADFSALKTPGVYRLNVPDVGTRWSRGAGRFRRWGDFPV